jgi:hypothetical protein
MSMLKFVNIDVALAKIGRRNASNASDAIEFVSENSLHKAGYDRSKTHWIGDPDEMVVVSVRIFFDPITTRAKSKSCQVYVTAARMAGKPPLLTCDELQELIQADLNRWALFWFPAGSSIKVSATTLCQGII